MSSVSTQHVVDALPGDWTWGEAFRANPPWSRAGGVIAMAVSLAVTADGSVPLATGLVLAFLVPAALVDIVDRRLPNRFVVAAAVVGVITIGLEHAVGELDIGWRDVVVGIVLGAVAMAGPLFVMHLVSPTSMGFGDVKAAAIAGAALGLVDPVVALTALAIGSGLAAVAGLAARRRTVPFGPGLVAGAIIALVLVASPLDPFAVDSTSRASIPSESPSTSASMDTPPIPANRTLSNRTFAHGMVAS